MQNRKTPSGLSAKKATANSKPAKGLQETSLIYDGSAWDLFKIALLNFVFTILTLGIYKFWGQTRVRRYVANSYALSGDRFEYTGTGKELFFGFLKALPIFLLIIAGFAFSEAIPLLGVATVIVLIGLFPFAIYSSMRYRFSRTQWRGIRGNLAPKAVAYAAFPSGDPS